MEDFGRAQAERRVKCSTMSVRYILTYMKKLVKLGRFSTGEAEHQSRLSRTRSACKFGIISTDKLTILQLRNNLFLFNVKFPIMIYEFQCAVTQIWNVRLLKYAVIILHVIKTTLF